MVTEGCSILFFIGWLQDENQLAIISNYPEPLCTFKLPVLMKAGNNVFVNYRGTWTPAQSENNRRECEELGVLDLQPLS